MVDTADGSSSSYKFIDTDGFYETVYLVAQRANTKGALACCLSFPALRDFYAETKVLSTWLLPAIDECEIVRPNKTGIREKVKAREIIDSWLSFAAKHLDFEKCKTIGSKIELWNAINNATQALVEGGIKCGALLKTHHEKDELTRLKDSFKKVNLVS